MTADLVSIFNLIIATNKLRAFNYRGLICPLDTPELLSIHTAGWLPYPIPMRVKRTFKRLGVEYSVNPVYSSSLHTSRNEEAPNFYSRLFAP